jgi:hypothetical protein
MPLARCGSIRKKINMNTYKLGLSLAASLFVAAIAAPVIAQMTAERNTTVVEGADNFYKSDRVTAQQASFNNQYGMKVVGNLFVPKDLNQSAKAPSIVVGHPMGAVIVPSAGHVDLYDRTNLIPFDKFTAFFTKNLAGK